MLHASHQVLLPGVQYRLAPTQPFLHNVRSDFAYQLSVPDTKNKMPRKAKNLKQVGPKKTTAKPAPFKETIKNLDRLQDLLRCVICGTVPDKVYLTSKCDHKYCKNCVTKVEGKICLICDRKIEKTDVKVDEFSTGLASRVKKFEHALGAMNDELKSNDDIIVITIK